MKSQGRNGVIAVVVALVAAGTARADLLPPVAPPALPQPSLPLPSLPTPAPLPPAPVQLPSVPPAPVQTAPVAVDSGAAGSGAPVQPTARQPASGAAGPARSPRAGRRARRRRSRSSRHRHRQRCGGRAPPRLRPPRLRPPRPPRVRCRRAAVARREAIARLDAVVRRDPSRHRASSGVCSRRSRRASPRSDASRSACSCAAPACAASQVARARTWLRAWASLRSGWPASSTGRCARCGARPAAASADAPSPRPPSAPPATRVSQPLPAREPAAPPDRQEVKGVSDSGGRVLDVLAEGAPAAQRPDAGGRRRDDGAEAARSYADDHPVQFALAVLVTLLCALLLVRELRRVRF